MRRAEEVPKINDMLRRHYNYLKRVDSGGVRRFLGRKARFRGTDLDGIVFYSVDLRLANFRGCDLTNTKFVGCNLIGANLFGAKTGVYTFTGCRLEPKDAYRMVYRWNRGEFEYVKRVYPEGDFVGYKKVAALDDTQKKFVAKLLIPADGRNIVFPGLKCRCDRAYVVEIRDKWDDTYDSARSIRRPSKDFIYTVGEWVEPDMFDDDWRVECSHGIHFFLSEKEAWDFTF